MTYLKAEDYHGINYRVLKSHKTEYISDFGCFDIETTKLNEECSIMYCWSYTDGSGIYFGRTWIEFKTLLSKITEEYHLMPGRKFVVYCFNLPFEFQFLRSIVEVTEMFAVDTRKCVKFTADDVFEFRCAYKLTNLSLRKFLEQEKVEAQKLDDFDYSKIRYSDTEMSPEEIHYSLNDTLGLYQALNNLMKHEHDDITTIPLTSTGYVRREARDHMQSNPKNRAQFNTEVLGKDSYNLCKMAVRGGNTHASWLYVSKMLNNVYSFDRVSSYPAVMVTKYFPVGHGEHEKGISLHRPIENTCSIMLVRYQEIKLKDGIYFPYIPFAKLQHYRGDGSGLNDNGRLINADEIVIAITEIDFEIIEKQYSYSDVLIFEQIVFRRGMLPKDYREFVMDFFKRKCELKGVDDYLYMKVKNKFNSLFGMMLTDICRESITYLNDEWGSELHDIKKSLLEYYNSRKSFLSYQHGIYVTAHARAELQKGLDIVGSDAVYCDTDSVKCVGNHISDLNKLNSDIKEENRTSDVDVCPYIIYDGKTYELGVWEDEGDGKPLYKRFVTHGAKKYAYEYQNGAYGVTVAGLSKAKGKKLIEEVGLEQFQKGLVFDPTYSGRMSAYYDDNVRYQAVYKNGHFIEYTSSMTLNETTYELGLTDDYEKTFKILRKGY